MTKTLPTALAVLGAGTALTVALVAPGQAQPVAAAVHPAQHHASYRIRFAEGTYTFTGADEQHPKPGDGYADRYVVRQHGRKVGYLLNRCTLIAGQAAECVGTLVVPGGHASLVDVSQDGPTWVSPMSGGTGRFAFATGTIRVVAGTSGARITVRWTR